MWSKEMQESHKYDTCFPNTHMKELLITRARVANFADKQYVWKASKNNCILFITLTPLSLLPLQHTPEMEKTHNTFSFMYSYYHVVPTI